MLLLGQDELVDVLLCLARLNILMVAFASRKLRAAVGALPPNRCLLLLNDVVLTKQWDYGWHEPMTLPGRVRRIFRRFVQETIQPYKLMISSSCKELHSVRRLSFSASKLIPAFLDAIRDANIDYVRIDLPHTPRKLEQMLLHSTNATGRIQELVVHTDCRRVPPFVFEALPFLAAEVASLQFCYPMNMASQSTPAHESEKLLRNCIDRRVYSVKLMDKEALRIACTSAEKSNSVSEETILEFCFAPRNVRPDTPTQVELWLNWIDLSPDFLSRFIQGSEACDSDHTVKLLLRGVNVCQQDMSQFRAHIPHNLYYIGESIWTNEGRYAVRVVRSPQTGFFFAHRCTLFLEEWYSDSEGFVISEEEVLKSVPRVVMA